jgi:hypothetical protein
MKTLDVFTYVKDGIEFKDYITLDRVYKYWKYNTNEIILPREMLDMYISKEPLSKPPKSKSSRFYNIIYLMMYNSYLQWFDINKFLYGVSYNTEIYSKIKKNIIFTDDLDLLLYKSLSITYHDSNRRFKKMDYKFRNIKPQLEIISDAYANINAIEYGREIKSIKLFDYFEITNHPKRNVKMIKYRFSDEIMDYIFMHPNNNVKFNFKNYVTLGQRVAKHIYAITYGKYVDRERVTVDIVKSARAFNIQLEKGKISYYFLVNKFINAFREIRQQHIGCIWGHYYRIKKGNGKTDYIYEIEKLSKAEADKIKEYKKEYDEYIKKELEKCQLS